MTVIFFQSFSAYSSPTTANIAPNAITRFYINEISAVAPGNVVLEITSPLNVYEYNTIVGIRTFHARAEQSVNFLQFQTSLPNNNIVKFTSLNTKGA
jgi:hypothetical protein